MRLFLFLFLFIFISINAFSQTNPPRNDSQFWNDTQFTIPLKKELDEKGKEFDRIALIITSTLRGGRNWQHLIDERIGFGFDFKVNKYLTLTPSYLYRADQPYLGKSERESRFRFAATLEKKFSKFSIKNRNLIEYRDRYRNVANSTRYRNKTIFSIPVTKDKKELFTPFIADEPYYDFLAKGWTRNEISAGISKKFTSNFTAEVFYLYQRNRGNILKNVNVVGVYLKFRIE
jgi:hypothetical protein